MQIIKRNLSIVLATPSLQPGGMERVLTELANYFTRIENVEVHIVLYGKASQVFYALDEGIVIHKYEPTHKLKTGLYYGIASSLFLRKKIIAIKPDSVLSFGTHWNNFVLFSLLGTSFKVFVSDRGSPQRKYKFIHELLRKLLYRRTEGIIAQTNIAKEVTEKILPGSKIKVIGNPIRLILNKQYSPSRENIILTVGRLISSKHHDRLIRIFSRLKATEWKLIIVGGDALKQKNLRILQQLISDLNLTGKVLLEGERHNVDEYYLKSKIFVFTSSVEGFPNVIGEALSAGLPTVSYDCVAGPAEMIVDGRNGFLVPVFADDLFLEKLQLLVDNETLLIRMSEEAKCSIDRFSVNEIGQKYYSFITSQI